ncbi:unnamed protein product [Closterium sp. NIES-53]
MHFQVKCDVAPLLCVEAMVLEWIAEPRVGMLMDLGRIRSRLPTILSAADVPTTKKASPAAAAASGSSVGASLAGPCCWRCSSCWAAYRRAVSFAASLVLVARCPRVVTLCRAHAATSKAYPAIVTALGARRQREKDIFASMMAQILGVKETQDLEEGFGALVQNLLSGGLEKAHAEKKGKGGTGVGGQMEHDGNQEGSWMDGGGKDGRDGKGEQWREHLKGHEWERYVDGMAWILEHGAGKGREIRCSHCSEGGSSSSSSSSSIGGSGSSRSVGATTFPKGMCVSGVGATEFALSVAAVLSTPEYCKESGFYFQDGNTASKARVEDAAIETARERLSRMARGEGGAAGRGMGTRASALPPASASPSAVAAASANPTPVNTNPVVAPPGEGSEGDPLRDLQSLLVRLVAIPKPLDQGEFPLEWEEWSRDEEAAAKLPDDASARFFHLRIVKEARGTAGERGAGEKGGQRSNAGGKIGTARGKGGDKGRGKQEGRSRGRGEEARVRGVGCDLDERLLQQLLTRLLPLVQRKFPIVRCTADAEFLLEFAGHMVKPPACAECKQCLAVYSRNIPFLALIANYAYRPATILFNRFVSIFPPLSPEFGQLAARIGVPPFTASVPGFLRSALVQTQAELHPVLFLLAVAHKWASPILGTTDLTYLHRLRDRKEEDGSVWEEVQMWCLAVELAWQGGMELGAAALRWTCKGKKEWGGWFGAEGEETMKMLLGEPCYCPASPAAPSSPATSTVAGKSAPEGSVRQRKNIAKDCNSARLGGAVCGALGCEKARGGAVKLRSCRGCGKVAYCSKECQKAHWPFHKLMCKSKASGMVSFESTLKSQKVHWPFHKLTCKSSGMVSGQTCDLSLYLHCSPTLLATPLATRLAMHLATHLANAAATSPAAGPAGACELVGWPVRLLALSAAIRHHATPTANPQLHNTTTPTVPHPTAPHTRSPHAAGPVATVTETVSRNLHFLSLLTLVLAATAVVTVSAAAYVAAAIAVFAADAVAVFAAAIAVFAAAAVAVFAADSAGVMFTAATAALASTVRTTLAVTTKLRLWLPLIHVAFS